MHGFHLRLVDDRLAKPDIPTSRLWTTISITMNIFTSNAHLNNYVYVPKSLRLLNLLGTIYHDQRLYAEGQVVH